MFCLDCTASVAHAGVTTVDGIVTVAATAVIVTVAATIVTAASAPTCCMLVLALVLPRAGTTFILFLTCSLLD